MCPRNTGCIRHPLGDEGAGLSSTGARPSLGAGSRFGLAHRALPFEDCRGRLFFTLAYVEQDRRAIGERGALILFTLRVERLRVLRCDCCPTNERRWLVCFDFCRERLRFRSQDLDLEAFGIRCLSMTDPGLAVDDKEQAREVLAFEG